MTHPIQDFEEVDGVLRFRENKIVQALVAFAKTHGLDLAR